jgi:hypothetical protein
MKKVYVPFVFLGLGAACLIAFHVIGSEVAPDGELIESFWLIPIGELLIAIGLVTALVLYIKK